jgi:hypothetical protein
MKFFWVASAKPSKANAAASRAWRKPWSKSAECFVTLVLGLIFQASGGLALEALIGCGPVDRPEPGRADRVGFWYRRSKSLQTTYSRTASHPLPSDSMPAATNDCLRYQRGLSSSVGLSADATPAGQRTALRNTHNLLMPTGVALIPPLRGTGPRLLCPPNPRTLGSWGFVLGRLSWRPRLDPLRERLLPAMAPNPDRWYLPRQS